MKYIVIFLALTVCASAQVDSTAIIQMAKSKKYPGYRNTVIMDTVFFDVPRWEDLREQPILINPVGAVASPTRDVATGKLLFNGTTDNAIALYFQTSHTMKRNYDSLYFHCHWRKTTAAGDTGDVTWTVKVQRINVGDTAVYVLGDAETEAAMIEEVVAGARVTHSLSSRGFLNSNIDHSAILYVTLTRDASADGYNSDVELMYVDIHFPVDKLGSKAPIPTEGE